MKKILGLDLGTNSIGWAVVNEAENADEKSSIVKLGVRTISYDNFVSTSTGKESKEPVKDFCGPLPYRNSKRRGAHRNPQTRCPQPYADSRAPQRSGVTSKAQTRSPRSARPYPRVSPHAVPYSR